LSVVDKSVHELQAALAQADANTLVLDVREPWEHDLCAIKPAVHLPLRELPTRWQQRIDPKQTIYVICHHGGRSRQAARFLKANGFPHVFNVTGGIHAWAQHIDPAMKTY
jgi:rhodanese-related sulfurtransferase